MADNTIDFSNERDQKIAIGLISLAKKYPNEVLVWCHEEAKNNLNEKQIPDLFHHNKFLFSFHPSKENYLINELGYIEESPYIKVNKTARYATWQMSSYVGAMHASVINAVNADLITEDNFDYFLNSLARRAMVFGLFCYSEPQLLISPDKARPQTKSNLLELFRFTKQHFKTRWVFLLFLDVLLYQKKIALLPLVNALWYKKRTFNPKMLDSIPLQSAKELVKTGTIDVVIPTIGRKEFLRNVLKNLSEQTLLPTNVIIIEQNPAENSKSDLEYLQDTQWPFAIQHRFTNQTGACNARNIALKLIESEFVFFADDDIVLEADLLEKAIIAFKTTGNEAFLVACLHVGQKLTPQVPKQFGVFGAGHAFVKTTCLQGLSFDMRYEFGFGEDNDFGMQLRNKGVDILYISTSKIIHLKAPIGGFRTKAVLEWHQEAMQPKPSPTVMLFKLLHDTKEQREGYKTILFLKNLDKSFFINPFRYLTLFRKKWDISVYWANKLQQR